LSSASILPDFDENMLISWNCTGSILAVAFSVASHTSFCAHRSAVVIYSLYRISKPELILETDCCVTTLRFHPTQPNVLLGGLFSGEVCLWNIAPSEFDQSNVTKDSKDTNINEPLKSRSKIDDCCHREPIASLQFITMHDVHYAVSVSGDGKVLWWNCTTSQLTNVSSNLLQFPTRGVRLTPSRRYYGQGKTPSKQVTLGGTALAFSPFRYVYFDLIFSNSLSFNLTHSTICVLLLFFCSVWARL
jgi:WD40 repeat protein